MFWKPDTPSYMEQVGRQIVIHLAQKLQVFSPSPAAPHLKALSLRLLLLVSLLPAAFQTESLSKKVQKNDFGPSLPEAFFFFFWWNAKEKLLILCNKHRILPAGVPYLRSILVLQLYVHVGLQWRHCLGFICLSVCRQVAEACWQRRLTARRFWLWLWLWASLCGSSAAHPASSYSPKTWWGD